MSFLNMCEVSKQFGGVRAVDSVNLSVGQGEFLVLVGPSGCGKTTLLRMIAGLEKTTSGTIEIAGRDVTDLDPGDRDVAMVFQNYALFPHMTVHGNLSFGMRMAGIAKSEIATRVTEAARFLQLTDLLKRKPAQLSGGQRQRVAMGRAIVRRPNAFLMDEPLSNLDANLRAQMRGEVSRIQKDLGVTTVYVTHDQVEAMTMADRVAVLYKGVLQQAASPATLYDEPANVFVAGFLGSPPMSFVEAGVESVGDSQVVLRIGPQALRLDSNHIAQFPSLRGMLGRPVALGIRPEDIRVVGTEGLSPDYAALEDLSTTVVLTEMLGADEVVYASVGASRISSPRLLAQLNEADPVATAGIDASGTDRMPLLISRYGRRSGSVRRGDSVRFAVDRSRLYLFDHDSGLTLRRAASN